MNDADMKISPEQRQFARVLEIGMRAGMVLLACGFAAYMSGWLPASVAPATLPEFWGLSVTEFRRVTGAPNGWDWLGRLGYGDTLPLFGIVVLCATTLAAFGVLLVSCLRRADRFYIAIATLEILVLLLAASGVLTAH